MGSFQSIFSNKTVLITGHTGFKGSWLSIWLANLGAKVIGLSINIPTHPSNFEVSKVFNVVEDKRCDIGNFKDVSSLVESIQPDFVFHLAAQALVNEAYHNPIETIYANSMGTANILESLRRLEKKVVAIMITSDKAYDNVEWPWGYREHDRIGGKDIYSASKGMAELAIKGYVESFFKENSNVLIGIARAGNVIGGGDWAKDRIVPDCVRAWSKNQSVKVRNPNSTRPWQHVLEPISGYLLLASYLSSSVYFHGEAYNFGPTSDQNQSVEQLINEMANHWSQVDWIDTSESTSNNHEAGLLKLNCDKALFDLIWKPSLDFKETIQMTADWYKKYYQTDSIIMNEFTTYQIDQYVKIAKSKAISWACND